MALRGVLKERPIIMGSYGIGVNRILAATIEKSHDSNGIIWPLPLAPYEVLVVPINIKDEIILNTAIKIYDELCEEGVEVLLDDRDQRPGFKLKDADLIGIPIRIIVGKRLKETGVLKQVVAIVDEQKVGLGVVTFVFVSLTPHDRETTEAFLKSIREIPNVMECHNISGVHDYLLKIVAPSINEYRNFVIDKLIEVPGVGKVETSVVLSSEKLSYQLPLGKALL